ncbi:MAG: LCP family protein [Clostridiales bacterium]|nr:LCP family protein [Clostridiales bacterium]
MNRKYILKYGGIFVLVLILVGAITVYGKLQKMHTNTKIVEVNSEDEGKDKEIQHISAMTMEEFTEIYDTLTKEEKLNIFSDLDLQEYEQSVSQEEFYEEDILEKAQIDQNVKNILVIGQDSRPGEQRARSDMMLLISYNQKQKKITMTSFLRDIWTKFPEYGWYKLNAAYAIGGAGMTINLLNSYFGLDIQDYIEIDFEAVVEIVDALGGLELDITKEEAEFEQRRQPNYGEVPYGENVTLTGLQVLNHATNRFIGDNDFGRTDRDRKIVLALYEKLRAEKSVNTLLKMFNIILEHVNTNMTPVEMISIGFDVIGTKQMEISQQRVPFDQTWKYSNENGQSVIFIDFEENKKKLLESIYGSEK